MVLCGTAELFQTVRDVSGPYDGLLFTILVVVALTCSIVLFCVVEPSVLIVYNVEMLVTKFDAVNGFVMYGVVANEVFGMFVVEVVLLMCKVLIF